MSDGEAVAYFSMEMALDRGMPTYSGGLGVLAGDTVRAAADLKVPMVAVTLLHRKGYFFQVLDADGSQHEEPVEWVVADFVKAMDPRVTVTIEGRPVRLRAWRYEVKGVGGFTVPVYLLDADLPGNAAWDRTLTHYLYGGDSRYRLCQEAILGIGGVRMLRALGYDRIVRFHMNEGHASLLGLELLEERRGGSTEAAITTEDVAAVRENCVFTTHTPVPAGHDQFPMDLATQVLGEHAAFEMKDVFCCDGTLNMTYLGLSLSHYVNGVAKKHGEISQHMFAPYVIDSITNGVDAATWTSKPFQELFDRHISGWREDNFSLRYALGISSWEVWEAHEQAKEQLLTYVNRETNVGMDRDVLTLGFARRAAAYKRGDLLFHDLDRLRKIVRETAPLQVVFAGKAHPHDAAGKELLRRIFRAKSDLAGDVRIAYLANYDMELGKLMTAGVDLWLNTPKPPLEASGTSGMKAALNGVPSLSVLDGWWLEGCIEGITGWGIGSGRTGTEDGDDAEDMSRTDAEDLAQADARDAESIYDKLETVILPIYAYDRDRWITVMRHAIALNGSFFNTQRMMQQYVLKAYFR